MVISRDQKDLDFFPLYINRTVLVLLSEPV